MRQKIEDYDKSRDDYNNKIQMLEKNEQMNQNLITKQKEEIYNQSCHIQKMEEN